MKTTCELMSNLVLPGIRAWIARVAIEKYGMRQKDVAKRLGLTKAAVSQYLKEKRANLSIGEKQLKLIESTIDDTAKRLAAGEVSEFDLTKIFCRICVSLRTSLTLCKIHRMREPRLDKANCVLCEEAYISLK
jgi:uncharacterized protein